METPDGYTLQKCLSSTPRQSIYRAVRDRDRCEVLLKSYPGDRASDAHPTAIRQFEALRAIEAGCGVRALEVVSGEGGPILVVEDFPGVPPRSLLEVPAFLDLAVRAARALAGVHRARWLHHNLAPERFLVHPVTGELRLTGFERAAPLGAPVEGRVDARFDLTLLYAAPEQSGRTERGVDARSDLYALGAVFYELLLGLPPFDSSDPLELIQAHVARRPTPPLEHRPELPPTLARIMLRLLEKEPEDRYQTAEAVAVDLENAREQLARTGRIDDEMPLASADMPYRPLFRRAVYGREHELESLRSAYRRAAAGGRELVLVRGVPGIGKSALIPELYRPLAEDGGYLVQGKFDLYRRHVPYSAFSAAFSGLAQQILSESETRVRAWCETLSTALGPLSGVIAELDSPLRTLFGDTPALPVLGPNETQQRLGLAVQRLLRAAAERAHPLVLFLDDLQWADAGSLFLLEEVLRAAAMGPLLVIGAYRQNEVDVGHPFGRLVERLTQTSCIPTVLDLGPLTENAVTQLLADALGASADQALQLATTLARKSGNNPLLVQQCVNHLHQLGVIHYERGHGWRWEKAAAAAADLPDDPASMMGAKLERLPRELREALQLASCVGDQFSLELLLELSRMERKPLEAALYALCDEGLIAPAREGFRFVHDRIREAAQAQLSERERSKLHREAALLLLSKTPDSALDTRVLEIADHLILARADLEENDRLQAIATHLRAGQLALRCGAVSSAARYFSAGENLFLEQDWDRAPAQTFGLLMGSAEAAYQLREFARAEELLDRLQARPLSLAQELDVIVKRINLVTMTQSESALKLTLATLRRLGLRWPKSPSWLRVRLAILHTDWLLRGNLETWTPPTVDPADMRRMGQRAVIAAGGFAMHESGLGLLALAMSYLARTALRTGTAYPGYTLAAYSTYRMRFLRNLSHTERYARTAEAWLRTRSHPRAQLNLWAYHRGWREPRRTVAQALQAAAEMLGEVGDIEYRAYALGESFAYWFASGEPLEEMHAQVEALAAREAQVKEFFLLACRRLRNEPAEPVQPVSAGAPTVQAGSLLTDEAWIQGTTVLCIMGEYAAAAAHAEATLRRTLSSGSPVAYLADCVMYRGIAEAALTETSPGNSRRRARMVIRTALRQLDRWAPHAPHAAHMLEFLKAERARLAQRSEPALRSYQEAAELALQRGMRHHAALAHERRSGLLRALDRQTESQAALDRAIELYREWGACAKVRQLETYRAGNRRPEASGHPE